MYFTILEKVIMLFGVFGVAVIGLMNSFMIVGLFMAANHKDSKGRGFILSSLRLWIEGKLGTYWAKPFLSCQKCMASVWGILISLIALLVLIPLNLPNVLLSILFSIFYGCYVAGLTTLIYSYYERNMALVNELNPDSCENQANDSVPLSFTLTAEDIPEELQEFIKDPIETLPNFKPDGGDLESPDKIKGETKPLTKEDFAKFLTKDAIFKI